MSPDVALRYRGARPVSTRVCVLLFFAFLRRRCQLSLVLGINVLLSEFGRVSSSSFYVCAGLTSHRVSPKLLKTSEEMVAREVR